MKWPTVLTFEGGGKMLFVKPFRRKYKRGWVAQWPRTRHDAELSDNLPDDGGRRLLCGFFVFFFTSRYEPSARFCPPAELIKTLTSSVSDRNTASISNESSGDTDRRRVPQSLPSGSRRDGAQGCFKIVISPSGQKGVDPQCTSRPGSIYCSQVNVLFSFISPFGCPHKRNGSNFNFTRSAAL